MQAQAASAAVCPECGTRLEGAFSRGLGRCMICLLRVGFDEAEEPNETLFGVVADRLGNYRIERHDDGTTWELGHGAMGVTYRAIDTSLQRPVALKLIASEWVKRGAEARERFMREARTAAALRHPNVATVYHFGIREENGQCFCAMELVEGETLETRVRRTGPLDALTTIEIALQVSSALAAAEKQGLVHRDLKPANLMLVAADSEADAPNSGHADAPKILVKVIDFGVAKALVEKPDAMGLTHGGFVGTPAFASPEQFTNAQVDVRSDIYSLGATLWYLLTGRRPFKGATIEQFRASQHSQALPIEQLKAARVPSRLISLLVSMLAPEPAARPSVRALTSQLQDCRAQILDRWKSARRLAIAAGLIGIAAAAFALFPRWHNRATHNAAPAKIPEKSIAMLPFENRSEDKENAFLADGMQDDVLTSLVQIKDLKVIGGSSVIGYRDAANRNLREIGQQLNVAYVLEGSVRRVANRMFVSVNLTDTRDARSVWAERYDRTIADSTVLQGELAADIAGALRATLAPAEKARLQAQTTRNPDAYVLYLRGREYQMRPEVSRENYLAAENFYKQAVAVDPGFALARARLAEMQQWLYYRNFDARPAKLAEARRNAEDAVRMDPDCGQAHMALAACMMANYLTPGKQDAVESPAAMRREVADAVRLLPNDPYIVLAAAMLQWDMGWNDEAAASFERAMVLNPREGKVFYNYGALLVEKDIPRSRWASDRALELSPDSIFFRLNRASWEIDWTGEVDRAKAILAGLPAGKDPDGRVTAAHCTIALFERDFSEALRLLADCKVERVPFLDGSFGLGSFVPKGLAEGLIHFWAGQSQQAYASLDSARWMLEVESQESAGQAEAHYHLALTYAAMGWSDAAKAEIARAYKKPDPGQMASFFTVLGDHDSAFPLIEQLVSAWRPARTYLRLHPLWDSLRGDPRFDKLLAQNAGAGN